MNENELSEKLDKMINDFIEKYAKEKSLDVDKLINGFCAVFCRKISDDEDNDTDPEPIF